MSINTIVIFVLSVIAIIGITLCTYLYLKEKTLEDIRADVYQLFLKAEHTYLETGSGQQKMKYVIQQARGLLPEWTKIFITDEMLERVVEIWFHSIKDLLDDGKLNGSGKEQHE
jgi:hypothetical protein